MHVTFDPLEFKKDERTQPQMQSKADYEWGTTQIATKQSRVLP